MEQLQRLPDGSIEMGGVTVRSHGDEIVSALARHVFNRDVFPSDDQPWRNGLKAFVLQTSKPWPTEPAQRMSVPGTRIDGAARCRQTGSLGKSVQGGL